MAEITYAIEAEEAKSPGVFGQKGVYGLGYGLFCTSFALGGSIGALMSGYVMAGAGWATLTWALAVWMAGGAVIVGLAVGETKASSSGRSGDIVVSQDSTGELGTVGDNTSAEAEGGDHQMSAGKVSLSGDTPEATVVRQQTDPSLT